MNLRKLRLIWRKKSKLDENGKLENEKQLEQYFKLSKIINQVIIRKYRVI